MERLNLVLVVITILWVSYIYKPKTVCDINKQLTIFEQLIGKEAER